MFSSRSFSAARRLLGASGGHCKERKKIRFYTSNMWFCFGLMLTTVWSNLELVMWPATMSVEQMLNLIFTIFHDVLFFFLSLWSIIVSPVKWLERVMSLGSPRWISCLLCFYTKKSLSMSITLKFTCLHLNSLVKQHNCPSDLLISAPSWSLLVKVIDCQSVANISLAWII